MRSEKHSKRGQGIVEFTLVLPILLMLLIGVAEVGYALRNYILVVNACREGARLAARGEETSEIFTQVTNAGDVICTSSENCAPGTDPTAGVIVTKVVLDSDGEVAEVPVAEAAGPVSTAFSKFSSDQIRARHGGASAEAIKAARQAADREPQGNHVAVVEIYFMHRPLMLGDFVAVPNPWLMYSSTAMRVQSHRERIQ